MLSWNLVWEDGLDACSMSSHVCTLWSIIPWQSLYGVSAANFNFSSEDHSVIAFVYKVLFSLLK